jgi:predicted lipid-binding transport protein (Tim44 family)
MATDLIVYAIIAAALVFWLRSILGTKNGEERDRPNPFTQTETKRPDEGASAIDAVFVPAKPDDRAVRINKTTLSSRAKIEPQAEAGLRDIARDDTAFSVDRFLEGAEGAFELVVTSFARGDTKTLRGLLEPRIYNDFEAAINDRTTRGETVETKIEAVRGMDIISARITSGIAYIAVRFTAQETCIIRNAAGAVIGGDPEKTTTMIDVWTFGRDITSNNPVWYLHESRKAVNHADRRFYRSGNVAVGLRHARADPDRGATIPFCFL